jgi:hypothetical protein
MTEINRRHFVASLTAETACTGFAPSPARSAIAAPKNAPVWHCCEVARSISHQGVTMQSAP